MLPHKFQELQLPMTNSDIKGKHKQNNGKVWYNQKDHEFKYKKDGEVKTVLNLETIESPLGSSLIGTNNLDSLGSNVQEVLETIQSSIYNIKSNIKWKNPIKINISFITLEDFEIESYEPAEELEYLLNLKSKKLFKIEKK
jgi:hypothetical protein